MLKNEVCVQILKFSDPPVSCQVDSLSLCAFGICAQKVDEFYPWLLYQISFPPVHGLKGFSVAGVEHDEGTDGTLVVSAGHVAKSLLKKEWRI